MCHPMSMLKFLAQMFVNTYILFACLYFFACGLGYATWISELEMFYFMLSMYLSSWWWVHECMNELQCITIGVKVCGG